MAAACQQVHAQLPCKPPTMHAYLNYTVRGFQVSAWNRAPGFI